MRAVINKQAAPGRGGGVRGARRGGAVLASRIWHSCVRQRERERVRERERESRPVNRAGFRARHELGTFRPARHDPEGVTWRTLLGAEKALFRRTIPRKGYFSPGAISEPYEGLALVPTRKGSRPCLTFLSPCPAALGRKGGGPALERVGGCGLYHLACILECIYCIMY